MRARAGRAASVAAGVLVVAAVCGGSVRADEPESSLYGGPGSRPGPQVLYDPVAVAPS